MIKIEQVDFPYCVTIPVSEENSRDAEWYNRLRTWLLANLDDDHWEIVETNAWIVAISVKTEQDAILIKVAWEDATPMPFGAK